jgi:hypothetical protein
LERKVIMFLLSVAGQDPHSDHTGNPRLVVDDRHLSEEVSLVEAGEHIAPEVETVEGLLFGGRGGTERFLPSPRRGKHCRRERAQLATARR